jgi:tetratricopeptide (TPR) repeat protein
MLVVAAGAAEPTPAARLAQQFARDVNVLMETRPLTVVGLETALILSEQAVELLPADAELWRQRFKLATVAERPELMREAVERLVALDPEDQVARLAQINLAIDGAQTAEERIAAYGRWLAPDTRRSIGGPVASRLALDLAILHRRMGDEEAFGRWLTESVTLDPGHRAAAALAAGYFRARVDDAYGQAELLVNLLLADPAGATAQLELGNLLLKHGAYNGAERMLTLAAHERPVGGVRPGSDLFADLAVAQWANGNAEAALRTIQEQQRLADTRLRSTIIRLQGSVEIETRTREEARAILVLGFGLTPDEARKLIRDAGEPPPSPLERAQVPARLDPTLTVVRAAILDRLGDPQAATALNTARGSYAMLIGRELNKGDDADQEVIARLKLEQSLVLFWLGGDIAVVERLVSEADEAQPLSAAAKERFAGLISLRRGAGQEAITRLAPLAPDDRIARLGLAMARLQLEQRREAAADLLTVARDDPGSLLSIWAAERLFELLGARAPINDEARRLEKLIESLPVRLDRCLDDPTLCVGVRIEPERTSYEGFDPLVVYVELVNNWRYPLSIDPDGPIEPNLVLNVSAQLSQADERGYLDPIVLDIDRRLTLGPRERITIPFDLRRHRVGLLLDQYAVQGAILRVTGITNFSAMPLLRRDPAGEPQLPILQPGNLGSETRSPPFRVDGVRLQRRWIELALGEVIREDGPKDIRVLAFLSHIAGLGAAARFSTEDQQLFRDAMSALTEAYGRLDAVSQAWVLSVIRASSSEPLLALARTSEEPLVKMAYVMYCLSDADDPMLDAARRDEDPRIRQLAAFAAELFAARASEASATP